MKKLIIIIIVLVLGVAAGAGARLVVDRNEQPTVISSFEECLAAGNPVVESFPRQCLADGQSFAEDTKGEYQSQQGVIVRVESPSSNDEITSPLTVSGQVPGSWSFEATFPLVLLDDAGNVLTEGFATLEDDWMTDDYVAFEGTLEFADQPSGSNGQLVLQKANAADLDEHDDEIVILIRF